MDKPENIVAELQPKAL